MNISKFLLLAILVLLSGCTDNRSQIDYTADIEKLENGLLPLVKIKGEEKQVYNIYDRMEHYKVPGVSIAFMDQGKIQWAKGYGFTDNTHTKAIDDMTLFQAASISKPVAAMAALHLVEEGKFSLDDNVNDYLINWQVEDNKYTIDEKVTIRRILSHSAGLTVHGFAGYSSTDTLPGIIDILNGTGHANSGRIFPDTVPGTIYRYSGGGYTVMQKMLCDITGKDFQVLMDEVVLGPIGMESSTYRQPLPEKLEPLAAVAHTGDGKEVEGRWHTYPEMAAAGLWTTPTDLLKYALEVQKSLMSKSNKVISKEMTEEMLAPQMEFHGLGPALGGKNASATFSHGGANAGYRCQLYAFCSGGQGVAIMTNSDNGDVLAGEIMRAFSSLYNWESYKAVIKEIVEVDSDLLTELSGDYCLEIPGQELRLNLKVVNNHLEGYQLWDGLKFEIFPESDNLFFNKEDRAPFKFVRDDEGHVNKLIVQNKWTFVKMK